MADRSIRFVDMALPLRFVSVYECDVRDCCVELLLGFVGGRHGYMWDRLV